MSTRTVVVVGAGALGSHVIQFLRSCGDIAIRVIDFDRVERKNVLSQFHGKGTVGKSKVQAIQQTVNFMFGVKVQTVPHKLVDDNAEQLLGGAALVLDCLDNGESREVVQRFVRKSNTPCLHGALDGNGTFGRVIWDADFQIEYMSQRGVATCENGEHLPFIAMVSSFLARAAQEFLTHGKLVGFHVHLNGATRV
jgi:molybdopterin/thiamine biosynthesis adenylyltransferase